MPKWTLMQKISSWLLLFNNSKQLNAAPRRCRKIYCSRKTSISHAFAEDDAGTFNGAGFLVDKQNRYIVTNAHVSGHGNANINIAFEGYEYEEAAAHTLTQF